jgi:hypothetical protein
VGFTRDEMMRWTMPLTWARGTVAGAPKEALMRIATCPVCQRPAHPDGPNIDRWYCDDGHKFEEPDTVPFHDDGYFQEDHVETDEG